MQGFSIPAVPVVETVIPNPKLRLLDQVSEVMLLRHYSMRTEQTYSDWVRRGVQFHQMQRREEMLSAEPKIEAFLSELAVKGPVAVSTQNQAFNARRKNANIERPTSNAEPREPSSTFDVRRWTFGVRSLLTGADIPAASDMLTSPSTPMVCAIHMGDSPGLRRGCAVHARCRQGGPEPKC